MNKISKIIIVFFIILFSFIGYLLFTPYDNYVLDYQMKLPKRSDLEYQYYLARLKINYSRNLYNNLVVPYVYPWKCDTQCQKFIPKFFKIDLKNRPEGEVGDMIIDLLKHNSENFNSTNFIEFENILWQIDLNKAHMKYNVCQKNIDKSNLDYHTYLETLKKHYKMTEKCNSYYD